MTGTEPTPHEPQLRAEPPGHQQLVQAMFAADRASRLLGIEITDFGTDSARGRMTVTSAMVNGHGTCHGGYLFLFADTVFSCACNSNGTVSVAAKADIIFVSPAREGDVLLAEAHRRTRFGRNGIYDVSVQRLDGQVVAEFRGQSRDSSRPLAT